MIFFKIFIKFILIYLLILGSYSFSNELIIPPKKPTLSDEVKKKIISKKNIIPPIKPTVKKEKEIQEEKKEKVEKAETDKDFQNIGILLPKKKPTIIVKKTEPKKEKVKKSKYYSKKDVKIAQQSLDLIKRKKWQSAIKIASRAKDKSIYDFTMWRYLLERNNNANYSDYSSFLKRNETYPRRGRIEYLSEKKLSVKKIGHKKIIDLFEDKKPLSGYGEIVLGESLLQDGQNVDGIKLIKKGWVTADLSKAELRPTYKRVKKYLSSDDHIKRADYLAWENKYWDLKRMLRYLPKEYQLLYNARQLLMSKSYGVDNAISKVPESFRNDPGLSYDRLKWRRKRGRVDSSLEILLNIKNTKSYMVRPDKWWVERSIIGRSLIYKKKYQTAYKIVNNHSLEQGTPEYAEAEWFSGWIALSFLNDPILAREHFKSFYQNVGYPISLSRGAFWLGRTYEKLGDPVTADKYYSEASKFPTTYYGQLAHMKIKPDETFSLDETMKANDKYKKEFKDKKLYKLVYLLYEIERDKYTKHILRHLALDNIEQGSEVLAAELATEISRYDFAIQISKLASYEKRFHNQYNYPVISTPTMVGGRKIPNPALILAVIRQESEFDSKANSYAGARGMMQLMTYTAKIVAKQAKLPYSKSRLTSDPEYNINLGSHYLAGLILEYDGAYPFAIAGYNAGPKRVRYWKKINKDPQKDQVDYVDWIELIKFKETRNYVQRVLENYNVYRYVLEQKPIKMKDFFANYPLY